MFDPMVFSRLLRNWMDSEPGLVLCALAVVGGDGMAAVDA